jgi:hypothetical protein
MALTATVVFGGAAAYAAARATLPPATRSITANEYRFWNGVRRIVPEGALVFTSFTGRTVTQATGWNYYPGVARRQLYLAGWADSPLVNDLSRIYGMLLTNDRVLAGTLEPAEAVPDTRFHAYYAAVAASARVPSSFQPVANVGPYALYRITR